MNSLIVFDSVFGNTEAVARAMASAIGARAVRASELLKDPDLARATLADARLLIAASPTRAFSPTGDMKKFLAGLRPGSLSGVRAAAFDTRADLAEVNSRFLEFMVRIFGYAAPQMSGKLVRAGATLAAAPEGFFVHGTEGPLRDGEIERAADWARAAAAGA